MYKIRISKNDKSIYDEDKDQVFDSTFPNFNAVQEGIGIGNETINNKLLIPTAFFVWTKDGYKPNSYEFYPYATMSDKDGSLTTNIFGAVPYKYIITQRKLNNAQCNIKPDKSIDYGLVVSKEGHDVKDVTWDNINFHSGKRTLQKWMSGMVDLSVPITFDPVTGDFTGTAEIDIPHRFGFVPAVIGYGIPTTIYTWTDGYILLDAFGCLVDLGGGTITYFCNLNMAITEGKIWFNADIIGNAFIPLVPPATINVRFKYVVIGAIT